jgi:hypothetical protein
MVEIYLLPAKYHPKFGDYRLNCEFIVPHWNRKLMHAIQVTLNVQNLKENEVKDLSLRLLTIRKKSTTSCNT